VLITGLRGVGKTVLLNEFEAMCGEAGWYADTKEVGRATPLITLGEQQFNDLVRHSPGVANRADGRSATPPHHEHPSCRSSSDAIVMA
jgi:hypothetical protein